MTTQHTVKTVSELFGVSRDMVERWIKAGKIKARRRNPFGKKNSAFIIPDSEVAKIKRLLNEQAKN